MSNLGQVWTVRVVVSLAAMAPGTAASQSADSVEAALSRARANSTLLVVALVQHGAEENGAIAAVLSSSVSRDHRTAHESLLVDTEREPQQLRRFGERELPVVLVLDGDGRVAARLPAAGGAANAHDDVVRAIAAADRHEQASRALTARPDDREALYWVGTSRWNRGERTAAVDCFERLAGLAPASAFAADERLSDAMRRLGEWELDAGRFEHAERRYRASMENAADAQQSARAVLGLSLSLRRQGRLRDAISVLEETVRRVEPAPGVEEALFTLGYLHVESGDRSAGVRHLQSLTQRFPASAHVERARRYLDSDREVHRGGAFDADSAVLLALPANAAGAR